MPTTLDALIITDAAADEQDVLVNGQKQKVLDAIIERISRQDIGWQNTARRILTLRELDYIAEVSRQWASREAFDGKYNPVNGYIKKEELLRYAETECPQLYADLQSGLQTREEIRDALWRAYQASMKDNGWELDFNYSEVIVDEARKAAKKAEMPESPNVVEVLFDHQVVAADFGDPKSIPYHMLGRGLVAEGARWPLTDADGKPTSKTSILLPIYLVRTLSAEDQIAYALALIDHEIIGHHILDLRDHPADSANDGTNGEDAQAITPEQCIMRVPDTRREFVELARRNRGLVFCEGCNAVYQSSKLNRKAS